MHFSFCSRYISIKKLKNELQSNAIFMGLNICRLLVKTYRLLNTPFVVLQIEKICYIFALVFHRILDFKTGLDFYLGPFFMPAIFNIV